VGVIIGKRQRLTRSLYTEGGKHGKKIGGCEIKALTTGSRSSENPWFGNGRKAKTACPH